MRGRWDRALCSTTASRASPTDTPPTNGSIYAHGPISYGVPGPKLIREIFEGIPHNLVIKTPKYAYQKEYRIIGRDRRMSPFTRRESPRLQIEKIRPRRT